MGSIVPGPKRPVPAAQLDADGATLDVDAIADGTVIRRLGAAIVGSASFAHLVADTLANLNAALTDATLDDSSAPRTDPDAIHDNVAAEISALTGKTTPSAGDFLVLEDSAASFAKRSVTYSNLEAALSITESQISDLNHTDAAAIHDNVANEISALTEKTVLVDADLILIEDSEAAGVKKKAQFANLGASLSSLGVIACVKIHQSLTHSVLSGFGVASVADGGTGITLVTLAGTPPALDDMTIVFGGQPISGTVNRQPQVLAPTGSETFQIETYNESGTNADGIISMLVIDNTVAS